MELPINHKDLDTIVQSLALGGDARLYHLLKGIRDDNKLEEKEYRIDTGSTTVKIFSETDEYQCMQGQCDI